MPVYLKLALATGMRRGELCALKWEHIDWEHGFIEVKKAIAYLGNEDGQVALDRSLPEHPRYAPSA